MISEEIKDLKAIIKSENIIISAESSAGELDPICCVCTICNACLACSTCAGYTY